MNHVSDTVICLNCGEETWLRKVSTGKYWDYAYGIPKLYEYHKKITACCGCEDYEEITDDSQN